MTQKQWDEFKSAISDFSSIISEKGDYPVEQIKIEIVPENVIVENKYSPESYQALIDSLDWDEHLFAALEQIGETHEKLSEYDDRADYRRKGYELVMQQIKIVMNTLQHIKNQPDCGINWRLPPDQQTKEIKND